MTTDLLTVALGYAERGWNVFPCCPIRDGVPGCGNPNCSSPGKHPLIAGGFKNASSDSGQIRSWWASWPDANIGIATGERSGIFVLDLDGPDATTELERLEAEHGRLPETVRARTGKGSHYYFRTDPERPIGTRAKLHGLPIDTRGTGGYVIAPPSNHKSGSRYEWVNPPDVAAITSAQDWLFDYLSGNGKRSVSPATTGPLFDGDELDLQTAPGIAEGGRHTMATRLIGSELARGADPVDVIDWAYQWGDKCNPPMDRDEVKRIVKDLAAKDIRKLDESIDSEPRKTEFPVLGVEAYHGLAGEIVQAIEPNTEADPTAVLVQLLALFGNAAGRGPYFALGSARHYANLFVMLVGESSTGKKGTALKDAMAPFGDDLKPRIGSGLSSGEGLIARVTDAVYKKEPIRDKEKKVTGYQDILETPAVKDKRLIVLETEFGSVLQVMKREGNTVSGLIRYAWDDGNLSTLTKVGRKATNAHITIVGHITPYELRSLLTDNDVFNGFANRFLWAASRGTKVIPRPRPHDLFELSARLEQAIQVSQNRTALDWDANAERLWEELCNGELKRSLPGRLDTLAGRARPQVIRLSLVYALLDCSPVIRVEHLRAAMAVWRYCLASARTIFGDGTGDGLADKLLTAIRERPQTTTELHRILNNHGGRSKMQSALQTLAQNGSIRCETVKTGGAPAKVWHPVP